MVAFATQVKRRRGTTAQNDAFTGAEGEIVVDIERHELRVHDGVTQGGFKIGGGSGAMPVGAIFTTPRTGTIQGAVEANGSPYNIADYSGDGSIGALLTAGNIAYVSKAEFQTQVTNTGACDSFGWDGTGDTTFLVPKLNPWHVGKNAPVVGNGNGIELTGIGQNLSGSNALQPVQGAVAIQQNTGVHIGLTTDPTKSGMIADLSETTNIRVMVQLATGATDQALETCTSVLSDVSALNAHRVIEFQAPTTANGYTWYRKYADGWVEQGGQFTLAYNGTTVTLPIELDNTNYVPTIQQRNTSTIAGYMSSMGYMPNTTTITMFGNWSAGAPANPCTWQISGKSAQ